MLYISEKQFATVWEVEDKGNYSLVKMSTSRKDKESGDYKNSSWTFVRFVSQAHDKAKSLKKQDRIVIKGGGISLEPYIKDGQKTYPKNPQIVVFNFDFAEAFSSSGNSMDTPPSVEDDDLPF